MRRSRPVERCGSAPTSAAKQRRRVAGHKHTFETACSIQPVPVQPIERPLSLSVALREMSMVHLSATQRARVKNMAFPHSPRFTAASLVALMLSGCAGTHFEKSIPAALQSPVTAPEPDAGRGLTVAVHWPAGLDPRAKAVVHQRSQDYARAAFGSMYDDPAWERVDVTGGLPLASTYYAAEALMALRRALPGAAIVLEPQMITIDEGGNLIEKPMLDTTLPIAVRLDLAAPQGGRFPFVNEQFTFSVRTPAELGGRNCGLYAASAPETDPTLIWAGTVCATSGQSFPAKPVWYLNRTDVNTADWVTRYGGDALPPNPDRTVFFPLVWYVNAGVMGGSVPEYVRLSRPATPAEADRAQVTPYIDNQTRIVVSVAGQLAGKVASPGRLAGYAAQFDPALGRKLALGVALSDAEAQNARLVGRLLESELRVRARRDLETARAILSGTYGGAVRALRDASFRGFKNENTMAWGAALSALAATTAAGPNASATQMLGLQQQQFNALANDLDRSGKTFLRTVAPSLQQLDGAWIEYAGQRVSVDVTDQSALSAALKRLYEQHRKPPARPPSGGAHL